MTRKTGLDCIGYNSLSLEDDCGFVILCGTVGAAGLKLYSVYNNGYPTTYGNLLNIGGSGFGEMLFGWADDTSNGHLYYRSKRDVASTAWSPWVTILDSSNYASTLDTRYVKKAGDTMTGTLTWSMNGVTSSISSDNASYFHYRTTAPSGHWFDKSVRVQGEIYAGSGYSQTVWHAGNDGSGSGLDADLLDGYHRSNLYDSVDTWLSSVGLSKTITVTGDKNTYYPVEITVSSSKRITVVGIASSTPPSTITSTIDPISSLIVIGSFSGSS